jgi:phosphoesterase RecJ-like protein
MLADIVSLLKNSDHFLITTHRDPDADGIGSMLALGTALAGAKKNVTVFTQEPLHSPLNLMRGSEMIVHSFDPDGIFSAIIMLDCSDITRADGLKGLLEKGRPLVNIDHHISNTFFGDINLVDAGKSSTGEIVLELIKKADLPIVYDVAENIFAAIQTDTGSFSYDNTTAESLTAAAEMMGYGVNPWQMYRTLMEGYGVSRLKLLKIALETLEFHQDGRIGMITVFLRDFERAGAQASDSERFVDYPRFVLGVEIAVMIRQTGDDNYKFSLRSNGSADVALLASKFGGGGHTKAAGFECRGSLDELKTGFLKEAVRVIDGPTD